MRAKIKISAAAMVLLLAASVPHDESPDNFSGSKQLDFVMATDCTMYVSFIESLNYCGYSTIVLTGCSLAENNNKVHCETMGKLQHFSIHIFILHS